MNAPVPAARVPHAPHGHGCEGPGWTLDRVRFRHAGATHATIDDVTLDVPGGRMTALLGPNGVGKSTLLELLLGTLAPDDGRIVFHGRPLHAWPRQAFARAVGVVPQHEAEPPFTVRELVAMGRYPHLGTWRRERPADRDAIAHAMERCDVATLADRRFATLSGGERQRVRVARALAQEPSALVLDEPTAALDVRHEMAAFELLRALRDDGVTIVLATHNVNLAARYADELVLLQHGRVVASGAPHAVLTADQIGRVYGWPVSIVPHGGAPQMIPRSLREAAGGDAAAWGDA